MTSFYVLDSEDRLAGCGGDWDAFARQNDAEGATAARVLSRPLWDFVQDAETTGYLNAIFFWCRLRGAPFEQTYRCDGPGVRRLFRMTVSPLSNRRLRVDHALVSTTGYPPSRRLVALTARLTQSRCSVCNRVLIGGEWIDPFAAPDDCFVPKGHGICPTCRAEASLTIRSGGALEATVVPLRA